VTRNERPIRQRRAAQQVANVLTRQSCTEDHIGEIADLQRSIFNKRSIATLRRKLEPISDAENDAETRRNEERWPKLWLQDHPGRTAADYDRLPDDELWEWRRAKGRASNAAEKRAWQRDHPGKEWSELLCGLSDREYTDYERWKRQYERKRRA
jgi:hypothetical protein